MVGLLSWNLKVGCSRYVLTLKFTRMGTDESGVLQHRAVGIRAQSQGIESNKDIDLCLMSS